MASTLYDVLSALYANDYALNERKKELSAAISGYTSGNAVAHKFAEVETSIQTLSTNLVDGEETYNTFKKVGTQLSALNDYVSGEAGLDDRIDAVEAQLAGASGVTSPTVTGYIADKIAELSLQEAITGVVTPAAPLSLGKNDAQQLTGAVAYDGKTIGIQNNALTVVAQLSAIATNAGFASSYALVDTEGKRLGAEINIPKDQFLKAAAFGYSSTNDATGTNWQAEKTETIKYPTLKLTFELTGTGDDTDSVVYVPMHDLVDDYYAGNGIALDDSTNTFSVSATGETFLYQTANGLGLSGVQDAIDTASGALKADIDYVSGQIGLDLTQLTTEQKSTIVGAINEVDAHADYISGQVGTLSNITGSLSGYSTVVDTFNKADERLAALEANAGIGDPITGSLLASQYENETKTASQGSVHNTAKELIGAADENALSAWISSTTTEGTGSMAELKSRIGALNADI